MVVHLEVKASLIKDLVKAIENVNEECVWSFDSEGLHIRMSDIYKYKMLDIKLLKEDFLSYSCDAPVELGVVIDRIKDVTKTLRTKDILTLHSEHDSTDITSDNFITLKSNGLSRSVKLIDIKMINQVPDLSEAEYSLSRGFNTTVDSLPFKNFLKAASKAISFDVEVADEKLTLSSKTDEGLVEVEYDDIVMTPAHYGGQTTYSVKEIESATSTMKGLVTIRSCGIEEGGLIEMTWNISADSTIKALVAPRE
jgi:DNA polymerase III sliding clamp (beta) subunit (PCNA family)